MSGMNKAAGAGEAGAFCLDVECLDLGAIFPSSFFSVSFFFFFLRLSPPVTIFFFLDFLS
jgi:hypothetical protein